MDEGTFEQLSLPHALIEDELPFMQPSSSVQVMFVGGNPSGVDLPSSVVLEVTETEPGVKGDTVSNVTKPATLETGAVDPGAALRQRRRQDQARPAAKSATSSAPELRSAELGSAGRAASSGSSEIRVETQLGQPHSGQAISSPRGGSSYSCRHCDAPDRGFVPGHARQDPVERSNLAARRVRSPPCRASSTRRSASSARNRSPGLMPTADLLRLAELLDGAGLRLPGGLRRRRLRQRRAPRGREPLGAHPGAEGRARRRRSRSRCAAASSSARARSAATSPAASSRARPRAASTSSACTTR